MSVFKVPLSPQPQKFSIELGGTTYNLRFFWNDAPEGGWSMNINDFNDDPIVQGIPLVVGADLLAQYAYLGFPGALFINTDFDPLAPPTFSNLGIQSNLLFLTVEA